MPKGKSNSHCRQKYWKSLDREARFFSSLLCSIPFWRSGKGWIFGLASSIETFFSCGRINGRSKSNFNRFNWLIHFRFLAKHVRSSDGLKCFFFRCAVKISFLHLNAQLNPFNWMEKEGEREDDQHSHAGVETDEFSSFLIVCYYIRLRKFFNWNSFNTAEFSSYYFKWKSV